MVTVNDGILFLIRPDPDGVHTRHASRGQNFYETVYGIVAWLFLNREGTTMRRSHGLLLAALVALGVLSLMANTAWATGLFQVNLVSDIPGLATITDPNLKNPWGVSFSATSPIWISNQVTSTADLFNVHGVTVSQNALEVTIPTVIGPQGPTGQVFNGTSSFMVNQSAASFIFANLNGTISAWNNTAGTTAVIAASTPGAVYTGLAIDRSSTPHLYAANTAQNRIDVFDGTFTDVTNTAFAGKFVDPVLPAGLAPFNVQNINGKIYVTYAPVGRPAQISATEGNGVVAVFDLNGNFIQQLITGSKLASPWGLALAPLGWDGFGGDLLVGNFSYAAGEINAFDPLTGAFLGTVISNPSFQGLWALTFGNGGNGGDTNILYFTTGLDGETHGLFAALTPVPEPSALLLLGVGLAGLAAWMRRRTA
jgi:uncharacterized protein (TIGR03118 family)